MWYFVLCADSVSVKEKEARRWKMSGGRLVFGGEITHYNHERSFDLIIVAILSFI